jgi:hypothetical protein
MAQMWPPKKNSAFDLYFAIRNAAGDIVSAASGLDSEVSIDGGSFADCTNEAAEIGSTGIYKLSLTAAEMNGDAIIVQTKTSTPGAKPFAITVYTAAATWNERLDVAVSSRLSQGAGALTRTVGLTAGGNPVEGASIWVSTDAGGANIVAGPLVTSSMGIVTLLLDAGSYFVWAQKDGFEAILGQSISVS